MNHSIARQIKAKIGTRQPKTAIILGSGLGALAEEIKNPVIIEYKDIEGFPKSTVAGHQGRLIIGILPNESLEGKHHSIIGFRGADGNASTERRSGVYTLVHEHPSTGTHDQMPHKTDFDIGVEVLCMQGRFHLYEGHSPQTILTIISAFKELGIETLIVTNAAGSLNEDMPAGSIMLIKDHINFTSTNPLTGSAHFINMSDPYHEPFRNKIKAIAKAKNIKLFEGVYFLYLGPNFETKAEIKAIKTLGADATGMSTVPEVIAAVHQGLKVLGFSVITNLGTGLQKTPPSHEETLREGQKAAANLAVLIKEFITHG